MILAPSIDIAVHAGAADAWMAMSCHTLYLKPTRLIMLSQCAFRRRVATGGFWTSGSDEVRSTIGQFVHLEKGAKGSQ